MDTINFWAKLLFWVCVAGCLIWYIARWVLLELRMSRNDQAPVVTCGARVLLLHPQTTYLPQERANGNVYHVTFRTDSGWEVMVYMNYDQFYILKEGTHGQLTYQGQRFWKFVPEA